MKKRIISFLFVILLAISMNRINVSAAYQSSGRSCVPKFTMEQLAGMYDSIREYSALYAKRPTISSKKYAPATLSSAAYAAASTNINYFRFASGLLPVAFNNTLNNSAAYAALINAANVSLSHTPAKPAGMSKRVYKTAYKAASSSNLTLYYGYPERSIMALSVRDQMDDSCDDNIASLGHRRWLLNPGVLTMGVGAADKGGNYVAAIRVFGDNVSCNNSINDYNFISWPASGNNLNDVFASSTPWSITLNPNRFATPQKSRVTVTLTQESNGKKWTFNQSTGSVASRSRNYFNINTSSYSINNCIIFRPAYASIRKFEGTYTVTVSGLTNKNGSPASLSYQVCFASRSSIAYADRSIDLGSYVSMGGAFSSQSIHGNAPSKTKVTRVKSAKKCLKASWALSRNAQGYQVQCSSSKKFKKGVKSITISSQKSSCKIKKLKSRKKYYVRVRAYRKVDGSTYYSPWSAVKSGKTR